jgi:nucleotide-binding universal stress UspA family protein
MMKIVVGVDGSEGSARALSWCAKYAGQLGAEVIAVHALELAIFATSLDPIAPPPVWSAADRDRILTVLRDEWCKPLADASVPFRAEVVDGYPPKVLIDVANRDAADLVVSGRRGLGGFKELLLGSTSNHLSHHLDRPLLLVP